MGVRNKAILKTVIFTVSAVSLFVWGAERQASRVNTDMQETDQSAYLEYAKQVAVTDFAYVGGRNRMPVYPALMSLLYREGMSDEEFFSVGKHVGIALGLVVLVGSFFIFQLGGHRQDAVTGTLVAMFTVFAFRSAYFQAEVLYYGVSLALFYLLLSLIQRPRITTAFLAGCIGGIAHLTKASVLPLIILAAACIIARTVSDLRRRKLGPGNRHAKLSTFKLHAYSVGILAVAFFLVVSPYLLTSKERFGTYFYNVNSTFYMWYDSWDEVKLGTRAHGDRIGWPDMPEENIPSLASYVRDHSPKTIIKRLVYGFRTVANVSIFHSYGYGPFMLLYIAVIAIFIAQNINSPPIRKFRATNRLAVFFVIAYFCGYWTLYSWYSRIAYGNRFILALFLPTMLLCVISFSFFRRHGLSIRVLGREADTAAINKGFLILLGGYLLTLYPLLVSTMYSGT